ncbi:MAG: hypothetical protein Q9197_004905, partial [Variospora fuerteventurae]
APGGRNAYGEKVGVDRLREALEAGVWWGDGGVGGGGEEEEEDVDVDVDAFERELGLKGDESGGLEELVGSDDCRGMREVILQQQSAEMDGNTEEEEEEEETDDGDVQVQEMESMMLKMQAIKDQSANMPEDKRRRFAAKAVTEVMRSIK